LQNRGEFNLTATLYDKRGRKLAVGTNSYTKTHPLQGKFAVEAGKPGAISYMQRLMLCVNARTGKRFERL